MDISKNLYNIGKYASRSSKSTTGDQFTVPMSGLFYDTGDNYDLTSNNYSFKTDKVWESQRHKS
jgi:hypothetical protein